jgi:hypothetical protein
VSAVGVGSAATVSRPAALRQTLSLHHW